MFFRKRKEKAKIERLRKAWILMLHSEIKSGESFVPKSFRPFEVDDFVDIHEAKYIRPVINKELGLSIIFYKK